MANGLNKVMLIGNLGADPDMRYTPGGKAVTDFRMAVNQGDNTEWFQVTCWDKLAEQVSQFLEKGRKVYVEGRLSTRTWETKEGEKRSRMEVTANQIIFLDAYAQSETETPGDSAEDWFIDNAVGHTPSESRKLFPIVSDADLKAAITSGAFGKQLVAAGRLVIDDDGKYSLP